MPPLAGRRLRLEFLEDRRLPAGPPAAGGVGADPPDSTTPARTAEHPSSPTADTSPEAAEYRAGSPPAATGYGAFGTTAGPSSAPGATEKTTYTEETVPAGRTAGATPRTAAAASEAEEYAATVRPTTTAGPVAPGFLPPASAVVTAVTAAVSVPVSTGPTAAPPGTTTPDLPTVAGAAGSSPGSPAVASAPAEEPPVPTPTPVSAGAESPAVTAPDPPLTSPASALARWVDDLAVRVDLPAGWDEAAARLLDGLAAAADDSSDPESGWVRLGYWIVTVAAVGVAIELSRQARRGRRPDADPETSPALVVKR